MILSLVVHRQPVSLVRYPTYPRKELETCSGEQWQEGVEPSASVKKIQQNNGDGRRETKTTRLAKRLPCPFRTRGTSRERRRLPGRVCPGERDALGKRGLGVAWPEQPTETRLVGRLEISKMRTTTLPTQEEDTTGGGQALTMETTEVSFLRARCEKSSSEKQELDYCDKHSTRRVRHARSLHVPSSEHCHRA